MKPVVTLEEQAEKVSLLIGEKIKESQAKIEQVLSDIAFYQNKVQTKKVGFKSKLKAKKEEQKIKYQNLIKEIQSKLSVQLAENEQITSNIDDLTKEIENLSKPKEIGQFEPINIDYSKKTQKILKEREAEIRKKCEVEFAPLFEKLKMEHAANLKILEEEFHNKVKQINDKAEEEISAFAPRVFISQEEIRVRQDYDTAFQKEKVAFEQKRNEIKETIRSIQNERDKIIQKITDDVDEQLFEEEKLFNQKLQDIQESVIEPPMPDFSKEYEFTPEQEIEFRKSAEQKLKENFQIHLEEAVNEVSQRRELMEKEMVIYEETKTASLKEKYENEISETKKFVDQQQEEIDFLKAEINSLKAEWTDMNQSRRDNEDNQSRLQSQVDKLNAEYNQTKSEIDVLRQEKEEEPDEELTMLQNEIDKLSKDMILAKKYHQHLMKKKKAKHSDSIETINQRVASLTKIKDDTIYSLTEELRNTKKKARIIGENLQSKLAKYQS
ncbi:ERC protein [Tritrichomonas foetus]|uniref:ERC protein n=1 Tax=Tritrichomonas foetus TaxID=1144522 RepID=A0A1J4L0T0_9EUKA|nr:ERC protein [Tritrichomonas foetus]|eukprot:OHT17129.1 ERC protein [Tritrichomonas foetus]